MQKFSWADNTGSSKIYDPSLLLMYNFDQRSSLGETNTQVKDISLYNNDAQVIRQGTSVKVASGIRGGAYDYESSG